MSFSEPKSSPDAVFTYEFHNTRPIELLDLTGSLLALGEQYRNFVRRHGGAYADDDHRLYVREVRTGSIIAELVSFATQPQILAPVAPFLVQFTHELGEWFEFFKGVKDAKDIKEMLFGATKKDLQQISQIVEPAAKDSGSTINFTVQAGGFLYLNTLNSTEANAIQNGLRREMEAIPVPLTGIQHDQVLYWYQMRADHATKPGDKAVIERLTKRPVKVIFSSDQVKREMIDKPDNPFRKFYVVDVDVTEVGGKPVLYRILEVKTEFDREDEE
jgi:hypothetical protein